jgi:outer membrane lipoprotein carrier protein
LHDSAPTRLRPRWRGAALSFALILLALSLAAPAEARRDADPAEQARIDEALARLDAAQQEIQSLRARFTEIRHLGLLAEPEVLRGELLYQRPGQLRWDYSEPERRSYVLSEDKLVGWIPGENRAEELDISKRKRRLQRLVAIGQDSEALEKRFRVELGDPEEAGEAAGELLVLEPKSRRIRKRVQEIHLWIHPETGLPHRVRYLTGEGDEVVLQMTDVTIDPQLSAGAFDLEIPPEAKVVRGLSSFGFGGFEDER